MYFAHYTECSEDKNLRECDPTSQYAKNVCIPSSLFCDGNFNCEFHDKSSAESSDESKCSKLEVTDSSRTPNMLNDMTPGISKDSTSTSTTTPSTASGANKTAFPWWLIFSSSTSRPITLFNWHATSSSTQKPPYIPTVNWSWNYHYKTPPTTGRPLGMLYPNVEYESENVSWAHRIPPFQVVLIFICVVFLIFGACTLLARMNTAKPNLFHGAAASLRRSRRNDR